MSNATLEVQCKSNRQYYRIFGKKSELYNVVLNSLIDVYEFIIARNEWEERVIPDEKSMNSYLFECKKLGLRCSGTSNLLSQSISSITDRILCASQSAQDAYSVRNLKRELYLATRARIRSKGPVAYSSCCHHHLA